MPVARVRVERSLPSTLARVVRLSSSSSAARNTACNSNWESESEAGTRGWVQKGNIKPAEVAQVLGDHCEAMLLGTEAGS
jgi:hypothetical protein